MSMPRDLWNWLRRQFVDDVPEGDALCEFDCRKLQCHMEEWEVCERRLRRAAGELMPDNKAVPEPEKPSSDGSTTDSGNPVAKT